MKKKTNATNNSRVMKKAVLIGTPAVLIGAAVGIAVGLTDDANKRAPFRSVATISRAETPVSPNPTAGKKQLFSLNTIAYDWSFRLGIGTRLIDLRERATDARIVRFSGLAEVLHNNRSIIDSRTPEVQAEIDISIELELKRANSDSSNPNPDWPLNTIEQRGILSRVDLGYSVDDGNFNYNRYRFTAETFSRWLGGTYAVNAANPQPLPQVYDAFNFELVTLPEEYRVPNWNKLAVGKFYKQLVYWGSDYYFVNQGPGSLQVEPDIDNRKTFFWKDVTSYAERLRKLSITGNTHDLIAPEFQNIVNDLNTEFGTNFLVIKALDGDAPNQDFASAPANQLPTSISSARKINFYITPGPQAANLPNAIVAGVQSTVKVYSDGAHLQPWFGPTNDAATNQSNIATYLDIDLNRINVEGYLHGVMNNLTAEPFNYLHTNFNTNGEMTPNVIDDNNNLVDVYFQLFNVAGANTNFMPAFVMRDYLAGRLRIVNGELSSVSDATPLATTSRYYAFGLSQPANLRTTFGFTAGNLKPPAFDRTWGRSSLRWRPVIVGDTYNANNSIANARNYTAAASVLNSVNQLNLNGLKVEQQIYTFIDTSTEIAALTRDNFRFYGSTSTVQVVLPQGVIDALAGNKKLALQYMVIGNGDPNQSGEDTFFHSRFAPGTPIPSNIFRNNIPVRVNFATLPDITTTANGFVTAKKGSYLLVETNSEGKAYQPIDSQTQFLQFAFRLIPTADEVGKELPQPTTSVAPSGFYDTFTSNGQEFAIYDGIDYLHQPENKIFVFTTDTVPASAVNLVTNNENVNGRFASRNASQRAGVPVTTQSGVLSQITLSGSTHDLIITGQDENLVRTELNTWNRLAVPPTAAQDPLYTSWDTAVNIGFSVADGRVDNRYYFTRANFITWLKGIAPATMSVFDADQNKVITIPNAILRPDWNAIKKDKFVARWIPLRDTYLVSDSTTVDLTTDQLAFWADMKQYLARLKAIDITGNTASLTSSDYTTILSEINTMFGAGNFQIEATNQFEAITTSAQERDRFTSTPLFTNADAIAVNNLTTRRDNTGFRINSFKQLGFRITPAPNRTLFISSSTDAPAQTNIAVNWTPTLVPANGANAIELDRRLRNHVFVSNEDLRTITEQTVLSNNTRYFNYAFPFSASDRPPLPAVDIQNANFTQAGKLAADIWGNLVTRNTFADERERPLIVYVRVNKTITGLNNNWMPLSVMKEYLAGNIRIANNQVTIKNVGGGSTPLTTMFPSFIFGATNTQGILENFGFNVNNVTPPSFDGNWGRGAFEAKLMISNLYDTNLTSAQRLFTPVITNLYTAREVTNLTTYLRLANPLGAANGISLYGEKGVDNGILVQIPEDFYTAFSNRKLFLQYTTNGKQGTQALEPADGALWNNVTFSSFAAGTVAGSPEVKYGFRTTLRNVTNSDEAFLAFRLVPSESDTGVPVTGYNSSSPSTYYFDTAKMTFFVSNNPEVPDRPFTLMRAYYPIGSGNILDTIIVDGIQLGDIEASGNTRVIAITGDDLALSKVDSLNQDKALDGRLRLVYSIDLANGDFINGESGNLKSLWLTKADFTAYLAGNLIVLNNRVVYRNSTDRIVEAFTPEIIAARNLASGDTVAPDYFKIDTLTGVYGDANRRNSIFVKWAAMNDDYLPDDTYIPSNTTPVALKYTTTSLKRWLSGAAINNLIKAIIVDGHTGAGGYSFDYTSAPQIAAAKLTSLRFKLQYALSDVTNAWSDLALDFSQLPWATQQARLFRLRVVPLIFTSTNPVGNQTVLDDGNTLIDYSGVSAGETPNTTAVDAITKDRRFKVFLNITAASLSAIKIAGNSFALANNTLNETVLDNDVEAYGQATIQYRYNGVWYTKANLLTAMAAARTNALASATASAEYTPPTDFTKSTVLARWVVDNKVDYYITNQIIIDEPGATPGATIKRAVTTGQEIDKTDFRTFINIWDVQDQVTSNFRTTLQLDGKSGQEAVIRLTGSITSVTGKIYLAQIPAYASFFTARGVKLQYSTATAPKNELTSTDWIDAASGETFVQNLALDLDKRALWIRFVPIDPTANVLSTFDNNGLTNTIKPIAINTAEIKGSITVNAAALQQLVVSGDTQANFAANENNYLVAQNINGVWGLNGATLPTNWTEKQVNDFVKASGLSIKYRAKATRTKGTYTAETVYSFDTLADFKAALNTKRLNFNRDSLEVSWGVTNGTQYEVSSGDWVKPNVAALVNVVYTEDVFTLTGTTYTVSGNDLKINAPVLAKQVDPASGLAADFVLTPAKLTALGLKIQFNVTSVSGAPSPTGWVDTGPTSGLNGNLDYWIRYAPVSASYALATELAGREGSQVTKLNVAAIKLAIPFAGYRTAQAVVDKLSAAELEGKTYDFKWRTQGTRVDSIPAVGVSADSQAHGKVQYSIDGGTSFYDSVAAALASSDYYGTGVLGFDKDRGDRFAVRYVFVPTPAEPNALASTKYVYTDELGNELSLSQLTRQISIANLIQPVLTTQTLGKLTGQASITVDGGLVRTPEGGTEFRDVTWQALANSNFFAPRFTPTTTSGQLAFQYMQYDNKIRESSGNYLFGLTRNPFNPSQIETKNDLTALAPRHTYFEYRTRSSATAAWGNWSRIAPNNVLTSTNFTSFEVRLAAEAGYELTGGTTTAFFSIDNSARQVGTIGSQEWSKEYQAAVLVSTRDISLPTQASQQATYVGFDDPLAPKGLLLTASPTGDHNPSNTTVKDVKITVLDNANPMNFKDRDIMYVIEWRVLDAALTEISWTDSRSLTSAGWHAASPAGLDTAPTNAIPWYGAYPTSLINGNVIQIRLRARDGFQITNDTESSDFNAQSRLSRWSKTLQLSPVSGLITRIDLPSNYAFYNLDSLVDFYGQPIVANNNFPSVSFNGFAGLGRFTINNPTPQEPYTFEVAVLRPRIGSDPTASPTSTNQAPLNGYVAESILDQQKPGAKITTIYNAPTATSPGGFVNNWQNLVQWLMPSQVTDLNVGDALVFRLVALTGYGFAWENPATNFADVLFPKMVNATPIGTPLGTAPSGQPDLNFSANNGVAPLPVRGLRTRPDVELSTLSLVYSNEILKRLNGIDNDVRLSFVNDARAIWRWEYELTSATGTSQWTEYTGRFPNNLRNGDTIKIRAKAVFGAQLDPAYNNTPVTLTVDNLVQVLDVTGVERPVMGIGGYEGRGTILSIANAQGQLGVQWTASIPGYPLGRPLLSTETAPRDLVWEYQVSGDDPASLTAAELARLTWTNTPPVNLKYGDYLRMRVGTVLPNAAAVALNADQTSARFVYSLNPQTQGVEGWVKVENLKLNPRNIAYRPLWSGWIGATSISSVSDLDTLDAAAVVPEYKLINEDGTESDWIASDADPSVLRATFGQLKNNQSIRLRVRAKPGYVMDPVDPNLLNGETISLVTTTDGLNYYLEKEEWTRKITNLQIYVETAGVRLSQIVLAPMPTNPETPPLIREGFATILPVTFSNKDSIVDNTGATRDSQGRLYSDAVRVRYILRALDPITGLQRDPLEITGNNLPTDLNNGDIIDAELYSILPEYRLSQSQRISFVVSGLVTNLEVSLPNPTIRFTGQPTRGTPVVTPLAPPRARWIYKVIRREAVVVDANGVPQLPVLDEDFWAKPVGPQADPEWNYTAPSDLKNGDYVVALLAAATQGGTIRVRNSSPNTPPTQIPRSPSWVIVDSLVRELDFTGYTFNFYDANNPQNPTREVTGQNDVNYAFKLIGNQDEASSLAINAPLYSPKPEDKNTLLVTAAAPHRAVPEDVGALVQFAWAVSDSPIAPLEAARYSTILPTNLRSGQYVHTIVIARESAGEPVVIKNFAPGTFRIGQLEPKPVITDKILTLIIGISVGVVTLGLASLVIILVRRRRRRLYFPDQV